MVSCVVRVMCGFELAAGLDRLCGVFRELVTGCRSWNVLLAADAEGRVLLVSSSEKLSEYTVQRISEIGGFLKSDWVYRGKGDSLGGQPIVDLSGLRLVMSTGEIVRVVEFDKLQAEGTAGNYGDGGIKEALR